jgi:hypothetical protein
MLTCWLTDVLLPQYLYKSTKAHRATGVENFLCPIFEITSILLLAVCSLAFRFVALVSMKINETQFVERKIEARREIALIIQGVRQRESKLLPIKILCEAVS